MALTDLAKLNIFLGETDTTTAKTQAVKWACGAIAEYCGRTFESTAHAEWVAADRHGFVVLDNWPLKANQNPIVRDIENTACLTLDTGYGAVIGGEDALTLDNNGTISHIVYADYATLALIVTAINDLEGWSCTTQGNYTYAQFLPITQDMTGGVSVYLEGPAQVVSGYKSDIDAGIISGLSAGQIVYVSYTAGYTSIPTALA